MVQKTQVHDSPHFKWDCDTHRRQFGTEISKHVRNCHDIEVAPFIRCSPEHILRWDSDLYAILWRSLWLLICIECLPLMFLLFLGSCAAHTTIFTAWSGRFDRSRSAQRNFTETDVFIAKWDKAAASTTNPSSRIVRAVHQPILQKEGSSMCDESIPLHLTESDTTSSLTTLEIRKSRTRTESFFYPSPWQVDAWLGQLDQLFGLGIYPIPYGAVAGSRPLQYRYLLRTLDL